jgi:ribosomal protein S18 acetylase RimI-like enzyme
MQWRVRQAGTDDADRLSLVANACFLDTYAPSLDGADLVAHCLNDPASVVTLAELLPGGAPIGYTVLTAPDFPIALEPGDIELRRIYTLRQAYGSGIGPGLITQAFEDARRLGGKRMLLGVWDQNFRAHAFYERQGFVVIGSRQFIVGSETHDDPIYARDL